MRLLWGFILTAVVYIVVECALAGFVVQEAWVIFNWFVPVGNDFGGWLFEGNYSGFFESMHSVADFELYVYVMFNVAVIFLPE